MITSFSVVALSHHPYFASWSLSVRSFRHTKDSNMTSAIRHGGVMRAAVSLDYAEPGEPSVVQFLTAGRMCSLKCTYGLLSSTFLPISKSPLHARVGKSLNELNRLPPLYQWLH